MLSFITGQTYNACIDSKLPVYAELTFREVRIHESKRLVFVFHKTLENYPKDIELDASDCLKYFTYLHQK